MAAGSEPVSSFEMALARLLRMRERLLHSLESLESGMTAER
jgi:hypothetical protein